MLRYVAEMRYAAEPDGADPREWSANFTRQAGETNPLATQDNPSLSGLEEFLTHRNRDVCTLDQRKSAFLAEPESLVNLLIDLVLL
jgi:hypothetical protein